MAHLCSRYLEKKLIKLQRPDGRNGYHSEDEVYGFLPTPFKRKNKRQLQDAKRRPASQTRASIQNDNASAGASDGPQTTKRSTVGLRDVTNNYDHCKTVLSNSKSTKDTMKDKTFKGKLRDINRYFPNTNSIPDLLRSDVSKKHKQGGYFRLDSNCLNQSEISISSRSDISHCSGNTEVSGRIGCQSFNTGCQSLTTGCQSSQDSKSSQFNENPVPNIGHQSENQVSINDSCQSTERNVVAMRKATYPRTVREVDACLLRSNLNRPANIVMFVVKRHFLKNESGDISPYKTCIGMLVNAIFSTKTGETFVRLPNGQAGLVPRDILKPVGVKNSRDFTQQYPENSTLDSSAFPEAKTPGLDQCIRHIFNSSTLAKNQPHHSEPSLNTSFSEGTLLDSTFHSGKSGSRVSHADVNRLKLTSDCELQQSNPERKECLASNSGTSEDGDDATTESSTDRQSLLDYLKLLESNLFQTPDSEPKLLTTDDGLLDTEDKKICSENSPQLINHCVTCLQSEPRVTESNLQFAATTAANLTNNSTISAETNEDIYESLEMDSRSFVESESVQHKNNGDISRISLCDITFRPALDSKHSVNLNNTYQNLPDLALLMKRCSVKSKLNGKVQDSCQSNDSGISQVLSTSTELCGETGSLRNGDSLRASHARTDSAETSLIARCGSYRDLCQSPDCAMCCPCKSCGFEHGSSQTHSSSTPCIDNLSSIHAASSTLTSDLTFVTSPESVTSAVTSFASNASMKYNCCSFVDSKTTRKSRRNRSTDGNLHRSKTHHTSSSRCDRDSLNKSVDLLKTIESIETTDSGNWSEMSSDGDESMGETKQPRLTALFDYAKKSVYDVSLRKQEVVTLINDQHPDWLWVKTENGNIGYIPRNFVVNLEKLNLDPHTKTTYL